jgi:hypothetical protein
MPSRVIATIAASSLVVLVPAASAARGVEPRAGIMLSGPIDFPREQGMTVRTDPGDAARLTVALGFDGRCKGGGLAEVWASNIPVRKTVKVKRGRFSAHLTATVRDFGDVDGRTARFRWRLTGRFVSEDVATARVRGDARVRERGHKPARCRIASPASVRLTTG